MGALNTAAIPAPPPAATITRRKATGARSQRDIFQATEPPICTAGPSGPRGNPLPMAMIPATSFTRPTRSPIATGRCRRKPMMWVMPAPPAAGEKRVTSQADTIPPRAPRAGNTTQAGMSSSSSSLQSRNRWMPRVNSRPVMAAPRPVSISARTTTNHRRSSRSRMLRLELSRCRRCFGSLREGTERLVQA